ncbi:MAG: sigma-70 family RNA polymerase sigma factor [Bacteroidia bacterium]|nr:sigma-70 family RNA polymerase sigma factor [Bacteroidia bacterium]
MALKKFPPGTDYDVIDSFEEIIAFTAARFITKNNLSPYTHDDLCQYIRLRLLETLAKIRENYKGEARLTTYISAVVLNLCREFRRKYCSRSIFSDSDTSSNHEVSLTGAGTQTDSKLHISYELEKLRLIFALYGAREQKVKIALMAYFDINISIDDVLKYISDRGKSETVLQQIKSAHDKPKKEIISRLTDIFNDLEDKNTTFEATKKWISRAINDILSMLNRDSSIHTKETLGILLEVYCSTDKQKGNGR